MCAFPALAQNTRQYDSQGVTVILRDDMTMKSRTLLLVAVIAATSTPYAAADSRKMVELPAPLKVHMLQNMRGHLVVVDQILYLLSEDNLDEASELAETELGMSSLDKHGASHIAPYYPEGMRQAGTMMHKSASQFSRVAQEGDIVAAIKALRKITSSCTACHAGYKVQ